jgi:hypothetical protein
MKAEQAERFHQLGNYNEANIALLFLFETILIVECFKELS